MTNIPPPKLNTVEIPEQFIIKHLPRTLYKSDGTVVQKNSLLNVNQLSDDCIVCVLQFVNPETLCSVSLVNKHWRDVSSLDPIWSQKCLERKWQNVKIQGSSIKSTYLSLCRELILTRADSDFCRQFTYDRSQPYRQRRGSLKSLYYPQDQPVLPTWPKHPHQIDIYSANDLVSDLGVYHYARFYLDYLLKMDKYSNSHPLNVHTSISRYIQFMKLKAKYPDHLLIPTQDIVAVWISHLLRPDKYRFDCEQVFGWKGEHLPGFPTHLTTPVASLNYEALQSTSDLWQLEYNEPYIDGEIPKNTTRFLNSRFVFEVSTDKVDIIKLPEEYPYLFLPNCSGASTVANQLSITEDQILLDRQYIQSYLLFMKNNGYSYCIYRADPVIETLATVIPQATKMYEKFMYLMTKYPGNAKMIDPTSVISLIWHSHMLNPVDYVNYCEKYLGYVLTVQNPTADCNYNVELEKAWEQEYKEELKSGLNL